MDTQGPLLSALKAPTWYGRKGEAGFQVNLLDRAVLDQSDGKQYLLLLSEISHDHGARELFILPVILGADVVPLDGRRDAHFNRHLLGLIQRSGVLQGASSRIEGERTKHSGLLDQVYPTDLVRPIGVEQTNSSVVIGNAVILKTFRKVERGLNPEWEIEHYLQAQGFRAMPALLGQVKLRGAFELTAALAHQFVPAESDGWAYFVGALKGGEQSSGTLLKQARALGARVAELHAVLARDSDDPAFSPEPIRSEDLQRWSSSITGDVGVALRLAEGHDFPGGLQERLVERLKSVAQLEPSGKRIRLHGDLHLGQVLHYRDDWLIFDFEGEPERSYAQRRQKYSPLKDVAGMLRSFSYAHAVASEAPAGRMAQVVGDAATSKNFPSAEKMQTAFLDGYRSTLGDSDLLPRNEETFSVLLAALQLEKVLYEFRYELSHRPDWVHIPARSLQKMGRLH